MMRPASDSRPFASPLAVLITLSVLPVVIGVGLLAGCSPFSDEGTDGAVAGWPPSAEAVDRGRAVYQERCATCHGQSGEGEPNWSSQKPDGTYPAPPHDSSGHSWHHADGLLFRIVRDGSAQFESGSFRSRMPAWGEVLTDEQIRAVITYLKTLWGAEGRAFQADVSGAVPFPSLSR